MENNQLTGGIPATLGNLTGLDIFNLSYNLLSGMIPRENSLAQFGFMSFFGNQDLCGAPWTLSCQEVILSPATPPTKTSPTPSRIPGDNVKDRQRRPFLTNTGIFVITITATVVVISFVTSLVNALIWRKKRETEVGIYEESYSNGLSSLNETSVGKLVLLNGFDSLANRYCVEKVIGTILDKDRIIGQGSTGTVYKATISDGMTIAVKKLSTLKRMRDTEEFEADMQSLDNLRHRNLVMLQGYYLSTTLKLIFSEFVPNGTLSDHLHRSPSGLSFTWLQRYAIGLGIARGLLELHCNRWYVTGKNDG